MHFFTLALYIIYASKQDSCRNSGNFMTYTNNSFIILLCSSVCYDCSVTCVIGELIEHYGMSGDVAFFLFRPRIASSIHVSYNVCIINYVGLGDIEKMLMVILSVSLP